MVLGITPSTKFVYSLRLCKTFAKPFFIFLTIYGIFVFISEQYVGKSSEHIF